MPILLVRARDTCKTNNTNRFCAVYQSRLPPLQRYDPLPPPLLLPSFPGPTISYSARNGESMGEVILEL